MANSSALQDNVTQVSTTSNKVLDSLRWTFLALTMVGSVFLLYFSVVLLKVFLVTPQLRESARYILFLYMLINDALLLLLTIFHILGLLYLLRISVPLCYIVYAFSGITYRVTPHTLGAMALEQYVAICHPLQHVTLCTAQRGHLTFIIICTYSLTLYVIELCVMIFSFTNIFNVYVICVEETLVVNPIQSVIRSINFILCFSSSAAIILFTYIMIMVVAKRASSQSSSASKAGKTVMLHGFQLLLCMSSILSSFIRQFPMKHAEYFRISNFFVFTCVPRFLSPLVYGIRDEMLRKLMKRLLTSYFSSIKI
ncbi:odorant receptor 131-2-like [Dendropsophus ebraccatus]|uniref:odorant receptor 131-2-like n=1 Tax=Dendropsophus ebraccatus TaxID=150705 RepID=UPI003831AA1B